MITAELYKHLWSISKSGLVPYISLVNMLTVWRQELETSAGNKNIQNKNSFEDRIVLNVSFIRDIVGLCKFICYSRFCAHHAPWRNTSIETVAAWFVDWETLSLVVYHIPELPQGRWHSWTLGPWQWGSSACRVLVPTPGSPCLISEPPESSLQDTKVE